MRFSADSPKLNLETLKTHLILPGMPNPTTRAKNHENTFRDVEGVTGLLKA